MQSLKLTPQYLQLITDTGETITVDAEGRASEIRLTLPPQRVTFALGQISPAAIPALIGATGHTIDYFELSATPTSAKPVWYLHPVRGTTAWQALIGATRIHPVQMLRATALPAKPLRHKRHSQ